MVVLISMIGMPLAKVIVVVIGNGTSFFERCRARMRCYIAYSENKPIGCVWLQIRGRYAPTELHGEFEVAANGDTDAYLIDAWVAVAHRGRRVFGALVAKVMEDLHAEGGVQKVLAAVDVENRASVRAFLHAGFAAVEELRTIRLMGRTIWKTRRDLDAGRCRAPS